MDIGLNIYDQKQYDKQLTEIIKQKNKEIDKLNAKYAKLRTKQKTAEIVKSNLTGKQFKEYLNNYGLNK